MSRWLASLVFLGMLLGLGACGLTPEPGAQVVQANCSNPLEGADFACNSNW